MNQLVSFAKNVSFMFGKKRGRRPVFNSNMFYPHAAERELQGATREEFLRFIAEALAVAEIGTQFADDISELSDFDPKLPDAFVEEISKVASDIEKKAMSNFSNQSEMIIGKPYYPPEVKGEILTNWESNFQMLCKSAETDAKKDLARLLQQGKEEGWNKNRLENAVKSDLSDKYRNRAELIARTETAKLNTQINLETYRNIGVEYYTWMTTIDGRERESHAAMNGLICSVSDPDVYFKENPDDPLHPIKLDRTPDMVHMHPGEDFQCRCSMVAWDPYINGSYDVKEMPEEEPEEKEPTPLEKAREETAKAEDRAERAEKENVRNVIEIQELKSKVSNFEKMIRAESVEDRNEQIAITKSLFNSVDKYLKDGIVGQGLKVLNREVAKCFGVLGLDKLDRLAIHTGDGVAAYDNKVLYINKDKFNAMVMNTKKFFEENVSDLEKKGKIRFLAINVKNNVRSYIFDHEFGHYLFEKYQKNHVNARHELLEIYQKAKKSGYINKISDYAKYDEYEFFSEIYAMSKQIPCDLPKYLLDFIDEVKK